MPEDVKVHLFEPFFTTKKEKGTVLGLSSMYGFVKKYDGFITVKSELGKGMEIILYFKKYPYYYV